MLSKIQFGLIVVYFAISFINLLVTRALADVDQRLAPNSYTAEVASTLLWNDYLRKYAKSFVDISPQLTFERYIVKITNKSHELINSKIRINQTY